jgi:putative membrane protein insertion efficiency factor
MKKVIIGLIISYQTVLSPLLRQMLGAPDTCRFTPSCSEYMKIAIEKYGIRKGIKKGSIRLLQCQPFSHSYANI